MRKIYFFMGLVITIVTLMDRQSIAQSQDKNIWPNFRGINCSGVAGSEQDPPIIFGPNQNVLWKTSLPEGHSSPCIWGDYIFITGFEEEGKLFKIFCIDRNNGTIKWNKDISVEKFDQFNAVSNPATATPATDGQRVYFYFSSYGLLCYDFKGRLEWKLPIPVPVSQHGMGTSPIVTSDLVILNCYGYLNDPRILAINKYDGSTVWKHSVSKEDYYIGDSYSTPIIYKDQVIISTSDDVAGYNISTGDRIWRFVIGVADAVCTPVLGKDILYTVSHSTFGSPELRAQFPDFREFAAKYDTNKDLLLDTNEIKDFQFLLYPEKPEISTKRFMIDRFMWWDQNSDKLIDSTEWKAVKEWFASDYLKQGLKAIRLGGQGDISISNLLWGNSDEVPHVSSPLYFNNHVYMIRDGGLISCFSSESGKLLYRERLGATGAYFSSPIAANSKIFIASRNGIVTVLEAGPNLQILARNDLKEIIAATPALVDSKLYLRTAKFLYAFGK
jgi:outer membrane protein assembly factor BamB